MSFYRKFYNTFVRPVMFLWRVDVEGIENIPEGGCILACNHTSMSDVIILSAAAGRQIRYMAKNDLFKVPLFGRLIRALGAYPVNRGGVDIKSIKQTMSMISDGELIGIFPQGTRHPGEDPRKTEIKGGVGMIAYHTGSDILPAYIDNKSNKTRIFRKNRVIFGSVIKNEELNLSGSGRKEYIRASEYVFEKVCDLKCRNDETVKG